ncbi:ligand-gated channel [Paracoccus suum]|uniref:Ligand-gated channel n=1 Tax=Paracoccus suum TaxID=2259340 RepID=A0A344PI10_9RHOB|nr:TonB-dependent receptor [Paracoccus suum]AXC49015.1 ligand-gated channel [Paracoccus suum]
MTRPTIHPRVLLAGASGLALTAVLTAGTALAQDLAPAPLAGASSTLVLDPITLIAGGDEKVVATGGVALSEEDLAILQPADVSELFARNSAVSVSGGVGPAKRIHVLGLEQSNLNVTVDGVPQPVTGWHHTGSTTIDPAFLKSVEVEAGAAAADSGFGAAAGAVRYETVSADDLLQDGRDIGGRAGLSYGSNGRGLRASLASFGKRGGFDWLAMVNGAHGDDYESGNGRTIPGSAPGNLGGIFKLGYEFEAHRVELDYQHTEDEGDRSIKMNMDLAGIGTDGLPIYDDSVYPLKITNDRLRLKYTTTAPTAAWDPTAEFYVSRNRYERPNYLVGGYNGDMNAEVKTVGGVLKNRYEIGPGSITAGVDFRYNDYWLDNYGDTDRRYWTLETMQVGAFAQGRFEFDNGVDVSAGARLDHQSFTDWDGRRLSGSGASVNGTISYEFSEGYEVFAGASRTWLGHEVGEFGLLHARDASFATAPDFEASTATNAKLGLNASRGNWTGNLTLFDTRLKNPAVYNADRAVYRLENGPEVRSRGVTLQGNYDWGTGRVGGSFTKAKLTEDGERALPQGGTAVPIGSLATLFVDQELPAHNVKLGASLEWAGELSGEYLRKELFKDDPGYTVLNVYADWRPEAMRNTVVSLRIDNLTDRAYYERSSYQQRIRGTRAVEPLYAPGRTITLGVNYDF